MFLKKYADFDIFAKFAILVLLDNGYYGYACDDREQLGVRSAEFIQKGGAEITGNEVPSPHKGAFAISTLEGYIYNTDSRIRIVKSYRPHWNH